MAKPSTQHKLDRVRPPRVQITYDVETGGAIEIKELPFVVGVLGDFTGQPEQPLPKLKERRFVEVTPDNFDSVKMRTMCALISRFSSSALDSALRSIFSRSASRISRVGVTPRSADSNAVSSSLSSAGLMRRSP